MLRWCRCWMIGRGSLPKECEMTNSLSEAKYSIIKRSGFISSQVFDDRRKKDLYVIEAGACVKNKYEGDARYNMGNSLMIVSAKLGMHFTACTSRNYFPDEALVKECKEIAAKTGGTITLTDDVDAGTKDADVIYTDVWVSMGEPDEVWAERIKELSPYQVNKKAMDNASKDAIFMHCLPAFHDLKTKVGKEVYEKFGLSELEVTDEVFESPQSVVFDEAENRMHTIKAVMVATL